MDNDVNDSLSTCSLGSTSEDATTNFPKNSTWTDSLLTTSLQCVGSATLQPLQLLQTADGSSVLTADSEGGIGSVLISVSAAGSLQQYCGELLEVGEGAERTHIIQLPAVDVSALDLKIEDDFNVEESFSESSEHHVHVGSPQVFSEMLISELPKEIMVHGIPAWALRMNDYEAIGDSYRGWVNSEVQLDLLLMYHRQQTGSCWGTRQSTGSPRSSLRLMWKSQYVPFDGVPFINAGSRAVVLECQYGPRRKGNALKRPAEGMKKGEFKPTCPARIYIKKVRKYPEYKVDLKMDKKALKVTMEKKFLELKSIGLEVQGEDRWYAQLPLESAHEFHEEKQKVDSNTDTQEEESKEEVDVCHSPKRSSRLDPHLAEKIRELVSQGETNVFTIRKQLRKYVENELFDSQLDVPDRHNLCFFPTIQGIQNNVYEALKDIHSGALPLLAPSLNFEVLNRSEKGLDDALEGNAVLLQKSLSELRTITVTLTRNNDPGHAPVISRIETQLSDGTVQVSTTLTPETLEILSQLHPSVFPPMNLIKFTSSQTESTLKASNIISEQLLPSSSATSEPFQSDNQNYTCQVLNLAEEDMQVPDLNLSSTLTASISAVDLCHEREFLQEDDTSEPSKMEISAEDKAADKPSEL